MKISIDSKILDKYKLTPAQFYFMLGLAHKIDDKDLNSLINHKYFVSQAYSGGIPQQNFHISHAGIDMINKVILESDYLTKDQQNRIEGLVIQMQELFPKGIKYGTNNSWRGNKSELKERMQAFFKKHGDYTDDQILKATQNYVNSYNVDTRLMKTLKYFISKKKDDGMTEYDLLTYLDMLEEGEIPVNTIKTTTLI